jgi:hypothetical protein
VYEVDWAVTTWETTIEAVVIGFGIYELSGVTETYVLVECIVSLVDGSTVRSR